MPYKAKLPWHLHEEDLDRLRGLGEIQFTFVYEDDSRRKAIATLGDEYEDIGLDRDWWQNHLSGGRKSSRTETSI